MFEFIRGANAFVLMETELTAPQVKELCHVYDIRSIVELPANLKKVWREASAEGTRVSELLGPLCAWLGSKSYRNDVVLLKGLPG